MRLPSPKDYDDPIKLLRESHRLILEATDRLAKLIEDAEKNGLYTSFSQHGEWAELIQFFSVAAPQHEEDEELALFPVMKEKFPKVGFQLRGTPVQFLLEGHQIMQERIKSMVFAWHDFLHKAQEQEKELDAASQQQFLANAKELVSLYRDHIKVEEENVYAIANNELSPVERIQILDRIRFNHHNSVWMNAPQFDSPTFSSGVPRYSSTDAISEDYLESSEEEESEE